MQGRLIAIVGPSGVGKDTVMEAMQASRSDRSLVKRHITRPPDPLGENHYALSNEEFGKALDQHKFVLAWTAHGLSYGISSEAIRNHNNGHDMLINLSRSVLEKANQVFDRLIVINLSAAPEILLDRLEKRGREPAQEIKARLQRSIAPFPKSLKIYDVSNDHHISETLSDIERILSNESQSYERNFA